MRLVGRTISRPLGLISPASIGRASAGCLRRPPWRPTAKPADGQTEHRTHLHRGRHGPRQPARYLHHIRGRRAKARGGGPPCARLRRQDAAKADPPRRISCARSATSLTRWGCERAGPARHVDDGGPGGSNSNHKNWWDAGHGDRLPGLGRASGGRRTNRNDQIYDLSATVAAALIRDFGLRASSPRLGAAPEGSTARSLSATASYIA